MYTATIRIRLRASILDPQGKATHTALRQIGFDKIERVRVGKFVEMTIDAATSDEATEIARAACRKLLANPVMEDFEIEMVEEPTPRD